MQKTLAQTSDVKPNRNAVADPTTWLIATNRSRTAYTLVLRKRAQKVLEVGEVHETDGIVLSGRPTFPAKARKAVDLVAAVEVSWKKHKPSFVSRCNDPYSALGSECHFYGSRKVKMKLTSLNCSVKAPAGEGVDYLNGFMEFKVLTGSKRLELDRKIICDERGRALGLPVAQSETAVYAIPIAECLRNLELVCEKKKHRAIDWIREGYDNFKESFQNRQKSKHFTETYTNNAKDHSKDTGILNSIYKASLVGGIIEKK
ncbi:hypothetical protein TH19_21745 [Thalassospira profundimaris]|uniref:Uncharacterized protein n=1 Tax=Thalassospira profundimaris TaxID=502049 RepID=A0A367VYY0_9PROT|nr:hypothetical protein [Thalassospira profundimaris]RCK31278.1 hypothetical protein TH19_21745 [Thalassospira profundimaris]